MLQNGFCQKDREAETRLLAGVEEREKDYKRDAHNPDEIFFFFPLGKSDLYITAMDIGENADMYSVLEYHSHTTLLLLGHKYS